MRSTRTSRERVAVEAVVGTAELAVLLVEAAHVINLIVAQMPDPRGLVEVSIRCERRVRNVGKRKGGSKDPWACGRGVRSYGRVVQESKATMLKEANAWSRACVFNSRRKRTNANVSCLKPPVVDILVNSPAMQHIPGSAHGQRRIRGQGVTGTGDLTCHACFVSRLTMVLWSRASGPPVLQVESAVAWSPKQAGCECSRSFRAT